MNLLKRGERWLADKQTEHAAERVTYARSVASAEVSATIGRSDFPTEDVSGLVLNVQTRDYIIPRDELELDGIAIEPMPGDRITEGSCIYEVSAPGPGIEVWKWDGEFRSRFRIHTKLVGETP
jgi:hypothetical protein